MDDITYKLDLLNVAVVTIVCIFDTERPKFSPFGMIIRFIRKLF